MLLHLQRSISTTYIVYQKKTEMSRPVFLFFQKLKKGSWKLPRKQTFLFPDNSSIANFILFVNYFFSVEKYSFTNTALLSFYAKRFYSTILFTCNYFIKNLVPMQTKKLLVSFCPYARVCAHIFIAAFIFIKKKACLCRNKLKEGFAEAQPFFVFCCTRFCFYAGIPGINLLTNKNPTSSIRSGVLIHQIFLYLSTPTPSTKNL